MKVGFIGLGDMGLPMAHRLLVTGQELVAWNRTPGKLEAIVAEGALRAATPADVMAQADLIGLCLSSDRATEEVAFGERGLFAAAEVAGKVVVDFSTGSPEAAVSCGERAAQRGASWIDAPVSGGVPAATAGTLVCFVGGEAAAIARVKPLLSAVASRVSHMGPTGSGQATKIYNQMIVACNLLVIAETFALARRAGVDGTRLVEAFKSGFADSTPLQIFGPRMAQHQFEPRLGAIALMIKDLDLANAVADAIKADTPMLNLARRLYDRVAKSSDIDVASDLSQLVRLFESTSIETAQ